MTILKNQSQVSGFVLVFFILSYTQPHSFTNLKLTKPLAEAWNL